MTDTETLPKGQDVATGIHGVVTFGTLRGLEVHGTGTLARANRNTALCDFDFARKQGSILHADPVLDKAIVFRRRILVSGRSGELLGCLSSMTDLDKRAGFFGTAFLLPADTMDDRLYIGDWRTALAALKDNMATLQSQFSASAHVQSAALDPASLPIQSSKPNTPCDLDVVPGQETVFLHGAEAESWYDDHDAEALQALAFALGERAPNIFLSPVPLTSGKTTRSETAHAAIEALRRAREDLPRLIEERRQHEERSQREAAQAAMAPSRQRPVPDTEALQAMPVAKRIAHLENRVAYLEGILQNVEFESDEDHARSALTPFGTQVNFDRAEPSSHHRKSRRSQGSSSTRRDPRLSPLGADLDNAPYPLWLFGILAGVLLALLAVGAWLLLGFLSDWLTDDPVIAPGAGGQNVPPDPGAQTPEVSGMAAETEPGRATDPDPGRRDPLIVDPTGSDASQTSGMSQ